MLVSKNWQNYKIIKCSKGKKLEIWNDIILLRPDPVVTWDMGKFDLENINAVYHRSNKGGGYWENLKDTPASWIVTYKDLKFNIKQAPTLLVPTGDGKFDVYDNPSTIKGFIESRK